jgi:enoyl-[acyl-carrier protein] reductase I
MAQKRVPAQRLMDTAEAGRVVAFPIGGAAFGMTGEHNLR